MGNNNKQWCVILFCDQRGNALWAAPTWLALWRQHPISSEQHVCWKKTKQQTHNQEEGDCVSRPAANPWCKFTTHQKEKNINLKNKLSRSVVPWGHTETLWGQECFCRFLSVTVLKVMFHFSQGWNVFSCSHIFMLHLNKSFPYLSHDMERKIH